MEVGDVASLAGDSDTLVNAAGPDFKVALSAVRGAIPRSNPIRTMLDARGDPSRLVSSARERSVVSSAPGVGLPRRAD